MATKVVLEENDNIETGLKNFRRIVQRDQILKEAKKHQYHMTRREKLAKKKKKPRN